MTNTLPVCSVHLLGMVPYQAAWDLQSTLAAEVAAGTRPPTLLLLEHPHTYTFGRRGSAENLLWDAAECERRGIEIHWVDRGGDVTYHGPGQLVGYPLLPLVPGGLVPVADANSARIPQADFTGYVRRIEAVIIRAAAGLGLATGQIPGLTGVWIQPEVASRCSHCPPEARQHPAKLAAIGVKVDARGVSRHGFSLNVAPDMSYWDGIIGCGLKEAPMISLASLLREPPPMAKVIPEIVAAFGHVFGYQVEISTGLEIPIPGRRTWSETQ